MKRNTYKSIPDISGHFGKYGGRFVAETLVPLILEVEKAYKKIRGKKEFIKEFKKYLRDYVGRPSPLYYAENLTKKLGGPKIYFKRDELNHTGAHKINNTLGQILLAKNMMKKRIIAETGAGQHGVATATVCALFNLPCTIYMGEVDYKRQMPNVFRMRLLGAKVEKKGAAKFTKHHLPGGLRPELTSSLNPVVIYPEKYSLEEKKEMDDEGTNLERYFADDLRKRGHIVHQN